jgi:predicted phosphodiesterase
MNSQTLRIVCVSDTHGKNLDIPNGDLLIHAGDFTHFGKEKDFISFQEWIAKQPHPIKIVVNGNHETNAFKDKLKVKSLIPSCTFLINEGATFSIGEDSSKMINIYGTDFYWPCEQNPYYDFIPFGVDIIISHGPAYGFVDEGCGCKSLLEKVKVLKPKLFVCGHIHSAHGVTRGEGDFEGITFVNAAICNHGYRVGWEPIVIDLEMP